MLSDVDQIQETHPALDTTITDAAESSHTTNETPVSELDPEILSALGEPGEETQKFGEPIHKDLAQRWECILKKGIPKDVKEKLMKSYLIPENCTLLQAPKINAEISAAVTDLAKNRDKKMESAQQQLGIGITAVNRGLSLLLTGDERIQAIKLLSDGCRILTDLHYMDTLARVKMLTPGLDKSLLSNVIKDTERDETLFGSKLSDKIKASKMIEKQGLQIKKTVPIPKTPQVPQSTVMRPRYQENWAGPSRYPSNRGGRGGARKPYQPARRMPGPAPPQNKTSHQPKPRAPAHQ